MTQIVASNFMYSIIAAILLVIVGGAVAFKADNKFGYVLGVAGVALLLFALRVHRLI